MIKTWHHVLSSKSVPREQRPLGGDVSDQGSLLNKSQRRPQRLPNWEHTTCIWNEQSFLAISVFGFKLNNTPQGRTGMKVRKSISESPRAYQDTLFPLSLEGGLTQKEELRCPSPPDRRH